MIIDAHHHYWHTAAQEQPWRDPAHEALARDYLPGDLAPQLAEAGVERTVLVQSVDTPEENDRLHRFADEAGTVAGVVGYLPLHDADGSRAELDRAATERWCGVRCLIGRDPIPWLTEAPSRSLFAALADRGLAWDVVPVTDEQTDSVLELADAVPELRIVVDHLARPPLDGSDRNAWERRIEALAGRPNVAMKVSVGIDVLSRWERWEPEALHPYVRHAVETFGPQRLLLASNWPVVELATDYRHAVTDLRAVLAAHLGPAELSDICGRSAADWYGLRTSDTADAAAAGPADRP